MKLSTFDIFKHVKKSADNIELTGENLIALQEVLANMLKDIVEACAQSGARYTLSGGTCLGSVRHLGFIPWDDDLDINMAHSDFQKFAVAIESLFPGKYTLQVPGRTPGYDLAFPRIRLNGTVVRTRDDFGKPRSECGAYVDIFYIENTPNNAILRGLHGFISMAVGFCYSCRRFSAYSKQYRELVEDDSEVIKTFAHKERFGKLVSFWSPERWTRAWDNWNSLCKCGNSLYSTIPVGRNHYFKEMHPTSVFFPVRKGQFNYLSVAMPGDTASYLSKLYGPDYMTPPEEGDREVHVVYEFDLGDYGQGVDAPAEEKGAAE